MNAAQLINQLEKLDDLRTEIAILDKEGRLHLPSTHVVDELYIDKHTGEAVDIRNSDWASIDGDDERWADIEGPFIVIRCEM